MTSDNQSDHPVECGQASIAAPLDDLLGEYFLMWEPRAHDTLFLAPDSECRGACHRLLIRSEAWKRRHEQEMFEAAARAIRLLKQRGGDLVIRENQAGEIVVRREAVGA